MQVHQATFEAADERSRAGWFVNYSAFCRLRQLVEVQGYESNSEAGEEDDRVLGRDGYEAPKASSLSNVTKHSRGARERRPGS